MISKIEVGPTRHSEIPKDHPPLPPFLMLVYKSSWLCVSVCVCVFVCVLYSATHSHIYTYIVLSDSVQCMYMRNLVLYTYTQNQKEKLSSLT